MSNDEQLLFDHQVEDSLNKGELPQLNLSALSSAQLRSLADAIRSANPVPFNADTFASQTLRVIQQNHDLVSDGFEVIAALGSRLRLNASIVQMLEMFKQSQEVGIPVLKCLRRILQLEGPDNFFRIAQVPLQSVFPYSPAADMVKGYNFSCWIKVSRFLKKGQNLFKFHSESGAGVQIQVLEDGLEVKTLGSSYDGYAREMQFTKIPFKFNSKTWYFISVSHTLNLSVGQVIPEYRNITFPGFMSVIVDSSVISTIPLPYPALPKNDHQWSVFVGGFEGDLGPFYIFLSALQPSQALGIYRSFPNFLPETFSGKSSEMIRFIPNADFKSGFITAKSMRILAKNASKGIVLPGSWTQPKLKGGSAHHEVVSFKVPKEVVAIVRPNHKRFLFTKGGLSLFLYHLSPQAPMKGRLFSSSSEVVEILRLVSDLLLESSSFLHQLNDFGVSSIKFYILKQVPTEMRDLNLLKGIHQLMYVLESMIDKQSAALELYTDFFTSVLCDVSYWRTNSELIRGKQVETLKEVCLFIGTAMETRSNDAYFKSQVPLSFFLNIIKYIAHESFVKNSGETSYFSEDECCILATEILSHCKIWIMNSESIDEDFIRDLAYLISTCTNANLKLNFIQYLCELFTLNSDIASIFAPVPASMNILQKRRKGALLQIFIDNLSSSSELVRIVSIKFLGKIIMSLSSEKKQIGLSEEIGCAMETAMSKLDLTEPLYNALIELSLGASSFDLDSDIILDPSHLIQFPKILSVLFKLCQHPKTQMRLKEKLLLDLLTLFKTNEKNLSQFTQLEYWHMKVIQFFDIDDVEFQRIVVEILHKCLWLKISSEQNGWTALDQILSALEEFPRIDHYAFQTNVGIFLIDKMQKKFLEPKNRIFAFGSKLIETSAFEKNTKLLFVLFEQWIFGAEKSWLVANRTPSSKEIQFCLGFIKIVIGHMISLEEREDTVRLCVRLVNDVLKFSDLFDAVILSLRQVFMTFLDSASSEYWKGVKLCLILLYESVKTNLRENNDEKAITLKKLILELFRRWGPWVINDLDPVPDDPSEQKMSTSKMGLNTAAARRSNWFELSSKKKKDDHMEEALMLIAQHERDKDVVKWFSEVEYEFQEEMKSRTLKLSERVSQTEETLDEKVREVEERTIENYFTAEGSDVVVESWNSSSNRLKDIAFRVSTKESDSLYKVGKTLKHFAIDAFARKGPSFWKIDRTENALRQRYLLRVNTKGHNHKKSAHHESAPVNHFQGIDPLLLNVHAAISSPKPKEQEIVLDESKEEKQIKLVLDCRLVTPLKIVQGTVNFLEKEILFKGEKFEQVVPVGEDSSNEELFSIPGFKKSKRLYIKFKAINQVLPRRYLARKTALEIFLDNSKSFLFNFETTKARIKFFRKISNHVELKYDNSEMKYQQIFERSGVTESWLKREISNFEYLMQLNTYAGRSFNDLSQYPVFPWILKDYGSSNIDLSDPEVYRDLSKPLGALDPDRKQLFVDRYVETSNQAIPAWHYGSHYSNMGIVLYYLIRTEPFTSLNVHLQGGRFDQPDRLFESIESACRSSFTSSNDLKELIPEFFYFPEFLVNHNQIPLGCKQDGSMISDVILPKWAKSPEQFIQIHREALESEFVSQRLHEWVDLIFGYKQKGPAAVEAVNIYFHLTYDNVDIDNYSDPLEKEQIESQISNFGQTPSQLFISPHPMKNALHYPLSQIVFPFDYPVNYRPLSIYNYDLLQVEGMNILRFDNQGFLIHAVYQSNVGVLIYRHYIEDILQALVSIARKNDPSYANRNTESNPDTSMLSQDRSTNEPILAVGLESPMTCFNISHNGIFLLTGGYPNSSLKTQITQNGFYLANMFGHTDPVSCISLSSLEDSIVTGSLDGSVTCWNTSTKEYDKNKLPLFCNDSFHIFSEHSKAVIDVSHSSDLGVIASIGKDGYCIIYSFYRKRFIRKFKLDDEFVPEKIEVCENSARLVIYGEYSSIPALFLYSINGHLVHQTRLLHAVTCISVTSNREWILCGDASGRIRIYDPSLLDVIQEIDCFRYTLGPKSSRAQQAAIIKGQQQSSRTIRSSSIDESQSDVKVLSLAVSRKGDSLTVILSDGRLLLYVLPNLLTPAQFEGLFSSMDDALDKDSDSKTDSSSLLSLAGFGKNLLKLGTKSIQKIKNLV